MTHPFQVLEGHTPDTAWNDNTMLAIVCDFIQVESSRDIKLFSRFCAYVNARAEEEADAPDDEDRETYSERRGE